MIYNIVMATGGLTFNGNTLNEKALGGSETAFIEVSKQFSRMGHHVTVYCNCDKEGLYDNVLYFNLDKLPSFIAGGECDIYIVSRFMQFFSEKMNSKLNILWNHDILTTETAKQLISLSWNIDYMYCLSDFHINQYLGLLPEIKPIMKKNSNGVDFNLINKSIRGINKKHKIMFTSRPERGLFRALDIYEKLGDKGLELCICNYQTINDPQVQEIEKYCAQKIARLLENGFNIRIDRFKKEDLYREIAESKAVIYPTEFPEIFCISGVEAQACGTPFLTVNSFAMKETVISDTIIDSLSIDVWVNELRKYVTKEHATKSKNHVINYTWEVVASKFIEDATMHFKERSKDKNRIIDRFIYESELVTAYNATDGYRKEELEHNLRYVKGLDSLKEIYEDETTHEAIDLSWDQIKSNTRFAWLAEKVNQYGVKTMIDYACHMGWSSILTGNKNPDCKITGYDISDKAINKAIKRLDKYSKNNNVSFVHDLDNIEKVDALFIGEYLEHVFDPVAEIDRLEKYVKPGGKMFITIPKGAWEWINHEENIKKDVVYHVHGFDYWDIVNMFGHKKDFAYNTIVMALQGYYGERVGNYLIEYTVDGTPTGKRDIEKKMLTYRPYQSISACIIAKDAAKSIENMIESISYECDEIIVAIDTATTDDTKERCLKYPKVKVIDMPYAIHKPDFWGFANARNFSIEQAKSEWILWIDTDEQLIQNDRLRKYLDTTLQNAYIIKQHHAQLDNFVEADKPQRIFRKSKGRFEGYIHEQPQSMDDINESIEPSLILSCADIVNFGAINEIMRRDKALNRNLQLLEKDVLENIDKRQKEGKPIRKLSAILLMRDFYNRINWAYEKYGTYQNRDTIELCIPKIKALYYKYFLNEENVLYKNLADQIMQSAYEAAQIGTKIDIQIGNKKITKRYDNNEKEIILSEIKSLITQ